MAGRAPGRREPTPAFLGNLSPVSPGLSGHKTSFLGGSQGPGGPELGCLGHRGSKGASVKPISLKGFGIRPNNKAVGTGPGSSTVTPRQVDGDGALRRSAMCWAAHRPTLGSRTKPTVFPYTTAPTLQGQGFSTTDPRSLWVESQNVGRKKKMPPLFSLTSDDGYKF